MELKGKVAVVTGAAQGIGEAVVRRFVAEGAQVVAADVLDEPLAQLERDTNGAVCAVAADLSSSAGVEKLFQIVAARFGGIDILVGCAAAKPMGSIESIDDQTIDRAFAVGVKGLFLCARQAAGLMRARGGGAIVTMSSFYARTPSEGRRHLRRRQGRGGSAHARARGRVCRRQHPCELSGARTGADAVRAARGDGNPETLADRYRRAPMKRFATVEEVADSVVFLSTAKSSYMTGHVMALDGGLTIV